MVREQNSALSFGFSRRVIKVESLGMLLNNFLRITFLTYLDKPVHHY